MSCATGSQSRASASRARSPRRTGSCSARPRARASLRADAHDLQAPGPSRGKQLVGVDVVPPADEVALRLGVGRPVDRGAKLLLPLAAAALELVPPALGLLGRRPLGVALRH